MWYYWENCERGFTYEIYIVGQLEVLWSVYSHLRCYCRNRDALCFIEDERREVPKTTATANVNANDGDIVTLIAVDTMEYRRKYENKAVKKTLTIPSWLNRQAEKENAPFSQILQQGLKDYLKIAQ